MEPGRGAGCGSGQRRLRPPAGFAWPAGGRSDLQGGGKPAPVWSGDRDLGCGHPPKGTTPGGTRMDTRPGRGQKLSAEGLRWGKKGRGVGETEAESVAEDDGGSRGRGRGGAGQWRVHGHQRGGTGRAGAAHRGAGRRPGWAGRPGASGASRSRIHARDCGPGSGGRGGQRQRRTRGTRRLKPL